MTAGIAWAKPTGADGQRASACPAPDDLARLLREPAAVDDVLLERLVEGGDARPELGQLFGCDELAILAEAQLAKVA